jgi:hypothetical protein
MGEGGEAAGAVEVDAVALALAVVVGGAPGTAASALGPAAVETGGAGGTASPRAPHDAASSAITAARAHENFPRVDGSWRTPPYNPSLMAREPSRDPSTPEPQPLDALDPWARERIERAVAPYRGSLSAADLDWMRAQLALAMEDDPEVAATVRAARGASEASGTVRRDDGGEG